MNKTKPKRGKERIKEGEEHKDGLRGNPSEPRGFSLTKYQSHKWHVKVNICSRLHTETPLTSHAYILKTNSRFIAEFHRLSSTNFSGIS